MSTTYSIACRDCKTHLWIAQSSCGNGHLYTGEPHTMKALESFLFAHMSHELVFADNCNTEIGDWEEIEPERNHSENVERSREGTPKPNE